MFDKIVLGFIEENNKLIDYLKTEGKNLSNEELLEFKKNIELKFQEQLKTILLLMDNKNQIVS